MTHPNTLYIGLDVHKESIAVAYVAQDQGTPRCDIAQLIRKQIVFPDYVRAVNEHTERLQCLEQALHEQVTTWRPPPVVEALQALRRMRLTVAVTIIGELGVLTPFDNSSQLMSYFGLTSSESSSGERRRQGPTTKTENTHARHALVEGAWPYRYPVQVSRHMQRRREKLPKAVQEISWNAHVRRCKRDRKLSARGKHVHQVVVAIARELITLIRAIAEEVPVPPSMPQPSCRGAAKHSIGSGAAPVCCHPQRRDETSRQTRASPEAGTRRTQVR